MADIENDFEFDENGTPRALQRVEVPAPVIEKWQDAAERIGAAGIGLCWEVDGFRKDPTRHMLMRLSNAAKWTAESTQGDAQQIASALKAEVDAMRERLG